MPRTVCLTSEELSAFHLGELPETLLEELADHLEKCARCEAAARALDDVSDPVMVAYRQSALAGPLTAPLAAPSRVGDYEILGEVGRGGMGVVYRARHRQLARTVALKMLLSGTFADRSERARFRTEAETVARLKHPGIVQLYEVGEHHDDAGLSRPYFTLEFVEGGSLSRRLAGRPQPPFQAASWVEALAHAAHYAHEQGIIHRDLKPSNVLLTSDGQPKICDFGVAKLLAGTTFQTPNGMLIGTVEYMAPEQTSAAAKVGPAADIYALGAILYTALTGRPPFQGTNALHTLEQVRQQEPVSPRRLLPQIPRDVNTICLRCLEKDPGKRYPTAAALADDLRRFLGGETIQARPTSALERTWKWARRRPVVAALSVALVLMTALGFGLVAWQWLRAEEKAAAETEAKKTAQDKEIQEKKARRQIEKLSAGALLSHGTALCEAGEVDRGLLWLVSSLEMAVQSHDAQLERVARSNLAAWQACLVRRRASLHHDSWVWTIALSRDGHIAATGSHDGTARLWDTANGRPRSQPLRHQYPVWSVALSSNGKLLLTGAGPADHPAGEARLWNTGSGQPARDARGQPLAPLLHTAPVDHVEFSPDGKTFLTVTPEQARLWRTADCRPIGPPMTYPWPAEPNMHVDPKMTGIFSPDGRLVATGSWDGTARLWDAATGKPRGEPLEASGPVQTLAFSPNGQILATGSFNGVAQMWDVATGKPHGPVLQHLGRVKAVAFSPDGRILATGSTVEDIDPEPGSPTFVGGEVRLWRAVSGRRLGPPLRHPAGVWSLAFSPGGRLLLTGCEDAGARLFLVATGAQIGKPLGNDGTVSAVGFSRDGTTAMTASAGGDNSAAARLWDLPPEHLLGKPLVQGGNLQGLAFRPDGRQLLTAATDHAARLWDLAPDLPPDPLVLPHKGTVVVAAFSPDGARFVTASEKDTRTTSYAGTIRVWEGSPPHIGKQWDCSGLPMSGALSPDGHTLLIGINNAQAWLWDMATGKAQGNPVEARGPASSVAFGPDGRTFATGSQGGIVFWDADTRKLLGTWAGQAGPGRIVFYPRGHKALLVAGGFAQDMDLATHAVIGSPPFQPEGGIRHAAFSPDGQSVLIGSADGSARLWDVVTGKTLGPPRGGAGAGPVAFSLDGRRLAVGGLDGRIALWDAPPPPLTGSVDQVRLWVEVQTGLELDTSGVVHNLKDDVARQRRQRLEALGGRPK